MYKRVPNAPQRPLEFKLNPLKFIRFFPTCCLDCLQKCAVLFFTAQLYTLQRVPKGISFFCAFLLSALYPALSRPSPFATISASRRVACAYRSPNKRTSLCRCRLLAHFSSVSLLAPCFLSSTNSTFTTPSAAPPH